MDPVTRLDAIEGIKLTKARHQRGVDTTDVDLLRRVFADDVYVDCRGVMTDPISGANSAPQTDEAFRGADKAIAAAVASLEGVVSVHHVSSPEIEITSPTTGNAIWPQVDRLLYSAGAPHKEFIGYGYYHETYERVGDDWLITSMRMVRTRMDFIPW
ncbi:nuclear transport factor 2 family protein [Rhodococcus pyridinivorans]|uniref:nuclear transport factor 2 family protein n=1 Tax=Rhodococcus pyridinivorans TaxID=103816 RepID=UPI0039B40A6A